MNLDTEDLKAIREIVDNAGPIIPLKIIAGLREANIQHVQLYASGADNWTLRIQRIGKAVHLEWLDINNERIAETILRGV